MTLRLLAAAAAAIPALILPSMASADCGRAILGQPACHVDSVIFACSTKELYKTLEEYLTSGDRDLFNNGMALSVSLDECGIYGVGTEVWRMSNSGLDGFVKVRKKGHPKAFWIRSGVLRTSTSPASPDLTGTSSSHFGFVG